MSKEHIYQTNLVWTGNQGTGTKTYAGYSRAHEISIEGKPVIVGSSDPHLEADDFHSRVKKLTETNGLQLAFSPDGEIKAVAGSEWESGWRSTDNIWKSKTL